MTLIWKEAEFIQNWLPEKIYSGVDEVLPAIVLSVLSLVIVSKFTGKKS